MKILHLGQLIGGLDIYIRNSIINTNNDFKFIVVHGKRDQNKPIKKNGKQIKEYLIDLQRNLNPWYDFKCIVQAVRIILLEKPDIIHCHSAKGGVIGRIAGFITRTKTFYTPHAFSFLSTPNKYKKKIYLFLEKIAKLDSYLLACSESENKLGIDFVKYKKYKALTWNNSVPFPAYTIHPSKVSSPYICYIGRPSYQKNTSFLIEVIKEVNKIYPNIHFLLLGVGYYSPDLDEVKEKINCYQLEKSITLLPWLSHSETMGYVKNALFYLSTAKYEGLPLAVIEAMALGKAIIASEVPGNKDCVQNGYNGFLLSLEVELFRNKIIELIKDDNMRMEFEENSRKYFEKQFNIKNRIKLLEDIYLNI